MQLEKKEVFCIECGDYKQFAVKTTREEITVRGVTFSYLEQSAYCSDCGEEVYVPEINDINVQAREDAYRKASRLITAGEVNEILNLGEYLSLLPLPTKTNKGELLLSLDIEELPQSLIYHP